MGAGWRGPQSRRAFVIEATLPPRAPTEIRRQNPPSTARRQNTGSNMPGSPTPEEREKADAEQKARQEAEQAALPYKWTQTIKDVDVTFLIDAKYKGRDLDVKLTKKALKVAIKGQEPFIDVSASRWHAA
jgi:hypothetical protein